MDEETLIISMYGTQSRETLISSLNTALPDVDNTEMTNIIENLIEKLGVLSDEEYSEIAVYSALDS